MIPGHQLPSTGQVHLSRIDKRKVINEVAILVGIKWYANTQGTELYSCLWNDRAAYLIAQYLEGIDSRALQLRRTRLVREDWRSILLPYASSVHERHV